MRMPSWVRCLPRRTAILAATLLLALLTLRAWDSQRGPPLAPWNLVVPEELRAGEIDATGRAGCPAAGDAAFTTVCAKATEALESEDRIRTNRYVASSPLHPARFAQDWNRSSSWRRRARRRAPWSCRMG